MSADTAPASVALPSPAKLVQYWRTTKTVAKTLICLLAIIGAGHVTEPMRADAATATVVQPAAPAKAAPGK